LSPDRLVEHALDQRGIAIFDDLGKLPVGAR
jgi:hypothetical protein